MEAGTQHGSQGIDGQRGGVLANVRFALLKALAALDQDKREVAPKSQA